MKRSVIDLALCGSLLGTLFILVWACNELARLQSELLQLRHEQENETRQIEAIQEALRRHHP